MRRSVNRCRVSGVISDPFRYANVVSASMPGEVPTKVSTTSNLMSDLIWSVMRHAPVRAVPWCDVTSAGLSSSPFSYHALIVSPLATQLHRPNPACASCPPDCGCSSCIIGATYSCPVPGTFVAAILAVGACQMVPVDSAVPTRSVLSPICPRCSCVRNPSCVNLSTMATVAPVSAFVSYAWV